MEKWSISFTCMLLLTGEWSGLDLMGSQDHMHGLTDGDRPQVKPGAPQAIPFIFSVAHGWCMGAALLMPDRTRVPSIILSAMESPLEHAEHIGNSHSSPSSS